MINVEDNTMEVDGEMDESTLEVSHGRPRTWEKLSIVFLMLKENVPFCVKNFYMYI